MKLRNRSNKRTTLAPVMRNYFDESTTGLKADIARHRQKESEIEAAIKECEIRMKSDPSDEMAAASLRTYRHFLHLLRDSKAEAVSRIGQKSAS